MRLVNLLALRILFDSTGEIIFMYIVNKLLFMWYGWKAGIPHWYLGFLPMAPVILAKKYLCMIPTWITIMYGITGALSLLAPGYFIWFWLATKWYKDYQIAQVITESNSLVYTFVPFWRYWVLAKEGYELELPDSDEDETNENKMEVNA